MVTSASADVSATETAQGSAPEQQPPAPSSNIAARIDFAHVIGSRLLLYGWFLAFGSLIDRVSIQMEDTIIDLMTNARRVSRPDVAEHFAMVPGDDEHGFYALIDLQDRFAPPPTLRLMVVLLSGETHESRWPIQFHDLPADSIPQPHATTLRNLLRILPASEAKRLSKLLAGGVNAGQVMDLTATLPPPLQFEIDSCCVLEDRILVVYGWLFDPAEELESLQVRMGGSSFDLFKTAVSIPRLDINPDPYLYRRRETSRLPGFIFVQAISESSSVGGDAIFAMNLRCGDPVYVVHPIGWNAQESRKELFELLGQIDVESAILLIERIAVCTEDAPDLEAMRALLELNHDRAVERLPSSIQHSGHLSRYSLHLDKAVLVAEAGVYLNGWFYQEKGPPVAVLCHCGNASFPLSTNWVRHTRTDVTAYLASLGIEADDHEHGFSCYVPLQVGDRPHWLSIVSGPGEEVRRMRVVSPERPRSALQTVRSLLATFHCEHREFRALMDRQIGPAVQAAWSARKISHHQPFLEDFGPRPPNPRVSVLVPLYGRWDFAEYQMALFANDEEFQHVDLVYIVDDPAIFDRFRNACADRYGIYRVPFRVVFSGSNLGFAGANNFGAQHARAEFLLLLNSDVLPRRKGWIGQMLGAYQALEKPGLMGAKLLYEDGSLQHAGISFRRHLPWGGLWINDHPLKGRNIEGLTGTREVSAVTAACALLETQLYRDLGGLSEDYIIGDFEDSDLCLRVHAAGKRNYVALDVELYHLERQSQNQTGDIAWRGNLTAYNCWLHHQRWAAQIERLSGQERNGAAGQY